MENETLHADIAVIGAGMAGMTVAATAAEAGASVIVVDIAPQVGGSAALSEGYVWTAPSLDAFRRQDPDGDAERFAVMLADLPAAFDWLEALGVPVQPPLTQVLGFGAGRQIDVLQYLRRCRVRIEAAGGSILLRTRPRRLVVTEDSVTGVELQDLRSDDHAHVDASAVVIATGGFQADPATRNQLLFPRAAAMVLRSNTDSRGGGLRLALDIGADLTAHTPGFYGHLVPHPITDFTPKDYALLAQYHSEHGLLLGNDGRRFTDESLGDHINTEVVARRGTALLVIDERIRREQVLKPFIPGMDAIDKMAEAGRRGANYVSGDSVAEIAARARAWGYDPEGIERGLSEYNACLASAGPAGAGRSQHRNPLVEPPFAALEVQAAITFTYRGLATDLDGRVLRDGHPIRGLFAAGVDAGGLNVWGYTGGLVRGLVLGRRTGKAITGDRYPETDDITGNNERD